MQLTFWPEVHGTDTQRRLVTVIVGARLVKRWVTVVPRACAIAK